MFFSVGISAALKTSDLRLFLTLGISVSVPNDPLDSMRHFQLINQEYAQLILSKASRTEVVEAVWVERSPSIGTGVQILVVSHCISNSN